MSRQTEGVDAYWNDVSEELGETVLAYTLGQLLEGGDTDRPLWGLFFLTETRFFFRHFPQTSWIEGLLTQKRKEGEEIHLEYQLRDARLSEPPEPSVLQKLFGSADRTRTLTLATGESIAFTVEAKPDDFVRALRSHTTPIEKKATPGGVAL